MTRQVRWSIVIAVVVLALSITRLIPWPNLAQGGICLDFPIYVAAAHAVQKGESATIYDVEKLRSFTTVTTESFGPYLYSPVFAQLLAPFASIEYRALQTAWMFLLVVAAAVTLVLLTNEFAQRTVSQGAFVLLLIIVSPLQYSLLAGQLDVLLLPALVIMIRDMVYGRWSRAAMILGVLLPLKHLYAMFLLPLVLERQWRGLVQTLLVSSIVIAFSVMLGGIQPWVDFVSYSAALNPYNGIVGMDSPDVWMNSSIVGTILRSTNSTVLAIWCSRGFLLITLIMFTYVWRKGDKLTAMFVITTGTSLAMPYAWPNHFLVGGTLAILLWQSLLVAGNKGERIVVGSLLLGFALMPTSFFVRLLEKFVSVPLIKGELMTAFTVVLTVALGVVVYLQCQRQAVTNTSEV